MHVLVTYQLLVPVGPDGTFSTDAAPLGEAQAAFAYGLAIDGVS